MAVVDRVLRWAALEVKREPGRQGSPLGRLRGQEGARRPALTKCGAVRKRTVRCAIYIVDGPTASWLAE